MSKVFKFTTHKAEKNFHGNWKCVSTAILEDNKVLTVRTSKNSSGVLQSVAEVSTNDGDGFTTHRVFEDFQKTFAQTRPSRCTAKVVEEQHNNLDFKTIYKEACECYNMETLLGEL